MPDLSETPNNQGSTQPSPIQFPIDFVFNIGTFANDFTATDANGNVIAYVRQKMFKLKEKIEIFTDESRSRIQYIINADRWIDFSAAYSIQNSEGKEIGKVARKGWRSLWKASYQIIDQTQNLQYHIQEENAWVRVGDSLLGEIPILNFFTGYFFNPSYIVSDLSGNKIAKLKKMGSFFGRKFQVIQLGEMQTDDMERIMLSLMMMILLERRRG